MRNYFRSPVLNREFSLASMVFSLLYRVNFNGALMALIHSVKLSPVILQENYLESYLEFPMEGDQRA